MSLSLQAVGAAAGDVVAIHNVVAASATVGLLAREGVTLRETIWVTLHLAVIGMLGTLAIYVLHEPDPLAWNMQPPARNERADLGFERMCAGRRV